MSNELLGGVNQYVPDGASINAPYVLQYFKEFLRLSSWSRIGPYELVLGD